MKRFSPLGLRAVLVLLLLGSFFVAAVATAADPAYQFRSLKRKFFKNGDGQALADLVGFQQPVKEIIALKYKVLLFGRDKYGKPLEKPVDPKSQQFKMGDKVRVTVEPYNDYYVYIFHIGPDGEGQFLLPDENEDPPLAKRDKLVALPGDGFFEFCPPPGTEQLFVVATEEPVADRRLLAKVLGKKPGEALTAEEAQLKKTLKATRKALMLSVQEQTKQILDKTVLWRGLATGEQREELARDIRTRGVKEGTFEEPGTPEDDGTSVAFMRTTGPQGAKLLVSIPLTLAPTKP